MIDKVILWQNGMVMVFDEAGQQISDYQGPREEVREKILKDAPQSATFQRGEWRTGAMAPLNRSDL